MTLRYKHKWNVENSMWYKQIIGWTNKLLYEQINDNKTEIIGT